MLTLKDAIQHDKLDEFVRQEEARGAGPVDCQELDAAITKIIKQPQSENRTSRSASGDGSTGK